MYVSTLPTSTLFRISLAPEVVPIVNRYPSALETGFQVMSVPTSTSISPSKGAVNVVHVGIVDMVCVVKLSSAHPVASPTALYGTMVTKI